MSKAVPGRAPRGGWQQRRVDECVAAHAALPERILPAPQGPVIAGTTEVAAVASIPERRIRIKEEGEEGEEEGESAA